MRPTAVSCGGLERQRAGGSVLFAGDPVAIAVKPVFVHANHPHRPFHIGRPVAAAARAIDVRGDGDAFAGVIGVALLRLRGEGRDHQRDGGDECGADQLALTFR